MTSRVEALELTHHPIRCARFVWSLLEELNDAQNQRRFDCKEIRWLLKNAEDYGYEMVGNSWVLIKP
jgi:hypothetical protein